MSLFVTESRQKRPDGSFKIYYHLRENKWDPASKSVRQRTLAHIGKERKLSRERAEELCEEHGLSMEELENIRGLEIEDEVSNEQQS